jgi:hypothetical protein
MVELGDTVLDSWNMVIIENPVEFLAVKPVKAQPVSGPAPATDKAAFQVSLKIQD